MRDAKVRQRSCGGSIFDVRVPSGVCKSDFRSVKLPKIALGEVDDWKSILRNGCANGELLD